MPTPFTRFQHPDPATNIIISDIYDKLAQTQTESGRVQSTVGVIEKTAQRLFYGTHSARLADYPASKFTPGTQFFETDRKALYYSDGKAWSLLTGLSVGPISARWDDLGVYGAGFLYSDPTTGLLWRWTGSIWQSLLIIPEVDPSDYYDTPIVVTVGDDGAALTGDYQRDWGPEIESLTAMLAAIPEIVPPPVVTLPVPTYSRTVYVSAGIGISRALATTYQNTGSVPLWVTASVLQATGVNGSITYKTDAASPPTTIIAKSIFATGLEVTYRFPILPGDYYRIDTTVAATLDYWAEELLG